MSNIYSLKTGLASDTTVWSGGVVPVSGDRVLICDGHTVTLDGTYEWGDDSTATVVINSVSTTASIWVAGTLKASRTVNSQLTANGHVVVQRNAGFYDAGTAADPIPLGVTHTLILNKSASLAAGKYGFELGVSSSTQGRCSFHGYARKRNTLVTSGALSAGATSCTVADATGWQVGDTIIFAPTGGASEFDERTIATLTPGSGTTATVTFSALTYSHVANCPVGNFSSNITVKPYSAPSNPTYMYLASSYTSGSFNGYVHFENVRLEGTGGSAASTFAKYGILTFSCTGMVSTALPYDPVSSCAFYSNGTSPYGAGQLVAGSFRQRISATNCAFFASNANANCVYEYNASTIDLSGCKFYKCSNQTIFSGYSQGCINYTHTDCDFFGGGGHTRYDGGYSPVFTRCKFGVVSTTYLLSVAQVADMRFSACDFAYTYPKGATAARVMDWSSVTGSGTVTMTDCMFDAALITRPQNFRYPTPAAQLYIVNKNADVTLQEYHVPSGSFYRDNAVNRRSKSSIRCEPENAATYAASYSQTFPAPNGIALTIVGALRKNSSYGASTLPRVEITGLGITPAVFTMTNSVDTWEAFSLNVTNSSGADGNLTLTFYGQSTAAGAACYLDGIASAPFVTAYRHYGYKFDAGLVTRTVNPLTLITESAANALSGLSINFSTQTITLTGTRSVRELYDWIYAQLCATANLSQPENFTSADGANFVSSYNLTIDGGYLTGSGAINMSTMTLSVINGGKSDVPLTHDGGVYTSISLSGIVSGSRVQVYDVTAASELYNDAPSGTTLKLYKNWTADHTIRVRATYCSGATAKLPYVASGVFGSGGMSLLLAQAEDTIYAANAIDGSAVTEFTADYVNVQVDVSDGDGSTSVQRLYAWAVYNLTTANGIAFYFGALTAEDGMNYRIDPSVVDIHLQNTSATPTVLVGARLYRTDETTIFAAGVGPIQADPGKAYIANSTALAAAVAAIPTNPLLNSDARLNHLDADVSSRLASSGYTAPPSASDNAQAVLSAAVSAPIHADTRKMNGSTIIGDGSKGNAWRGAD